MPEKKRGKGRVVLIVVAVLVVLGVIGCLGRGGSGSGTTSTAAKPTASQSHAASSAKAPASASSSSQGATSTSAGGSAAQAESSAKEQPPSADVPDQDSGNMAVTPELKSFLDSYEAFMDEYVVFMGKYKENPSDTTLLLEYSKYLQKYSDFVAKAEAIDQKNLSKADLSYYLEVTSRVSQKLLNAAM